MNRDHPKSFELDVAQGLQIDEVCTRFEQQLRAGQDPQIEAFLTDDSEPFRSHLLTNLLQLEFEYRNGTDGSFEIQEYIERFPQDQFLIQAVYDEQEQMPSVSSRYQIVEKLGQGGMGVVYLADDRTLNRKVALKFLAESFEHHPNAWERLLREARAAAAIDHPFACSIYEVGEADGQTFIAMEYVPGETLKDRLKRGAVPPQDAVSIALEISEALASAHERGIIHRDLKPGNIMLTRDGHAQVMDFGLAGHILLKNMV
jgi:predicted Ser/Thr protein kinase